MHFLRDIVEGPLYVETIIYLFHVYIRNIHTDAISATLVVIVEFRRLIKRSIHG